jgi:hypothetical protein
MPEVNWKSSLVDQMSFTWEHMFVPRMDGLTDDEYLWAPVADVWTVHPGEGGAAPTIDPHQRADPAPFTTVAWRLHHMTDVFTKRWVYHFGHPGVDDLDAPVTLIATEGLANLTHAYERWKDALESISDERLSAPCGPAEHRFSEWPFADLILHINREFIHHAAECALLRDLYRQRESLR